MYDYCMRILTEKFSVAFIIMVLLVPYITYAYPAGTPSWDDWDGDGNRWTHGEDNDGWTSSGGGGGGGGGGNNNNPQTVEIDRNLGTTANVQTNRPGADYVLSHTQVINGRTYQIYDYTGTVRPVLPGQSNPNPAGFVAVLINDNNDNGHSCSASRPNLVIEDIYLVRTSSSSEDVDEVNLGTDIEYRPYAIVRNTSCKSTNSSGNNLSLPSVAASGSFPVRLRIDYNSTDTANPSYEYTEQIGFVGPLGGNMSMAVAFDPVTFTSLASHVFQVTADPIANQQSFETCTGGVGCIRESNDTDNTRTETFRTTPPSVTVGSFVWSSNVRLSSSNNYWTTWDHLTTPVRDMVARPLASSDHEVGIYWIGNKVNLDQCTGVGINNDLRNTADWWRVNWTGSNHSESRFWAGRRASGAYPSWPMGFWSGGDNWDIRPVGGTMEQKLAFADNKIFWRGSEQYHRTMAVFVNRGFRQAVAAGNYHEYTVTCPAYNGSTVSDTHIVRNGTRPGVTLPVSLQPNLPDVTVTAGEVVDRVPFTIQNNGAEAISGMTYTLTINGVAVHTVASSSRVTAGGLLSTRPVVNWTAPNNARNVPMELCVNHPGRATTTPICDRGVITVTAVPTHPLSCDTFTISDNTLEAGQTATVTWSTSNATFATLQDTLNGTTMMVGASGTSPAIIFSQNANLRLTAFRGAERQSCPDIFVQVTPATNPDLAVANFTISTCTDEVATNCPTTTWQATVQNIGITATQTAPYVLQRRVGPATWTTVATGNIPALAISASTQISGTVRNIVPGNYVWRVIVNEPERYPEETRANNISNPVNFIITQIRTPQCSDGDDNDGDGYTDRNDSGCRPNPNEPEGPTNTYDPDDDSEAVVDNPQITITANPAIIRYGDTATIEYSISNPNPLTCTMTGPGMPTTITYPGNVGPSEALQGTHISAPLTSTQTFTITCGATRAQTTVEVIPLAQEI